MCFVLVIPYNAQEMKAEHLFELLSVFKKKSYSEWQLIQLGYKNKMQVPPVL